MRVKKISVVFVACILSVGLFLGQEKAEKRVEKLTKETSPQKQGKSLIKMQLLSKQTEELKPPKRNIFSPSLEYSPEIMTREEAKREVGETAPETKEGMDESLAEISYIGYIVQGATITALIVFEEETIAVQEGEMITQDLKVIKVSSQYVEVEGPGGKRRKFSIEGEGQ